MKTITKTAYLSACKFNADDGINRHFELCVYDSPMATNSSFIHVPLGEAEVTFEVPDDYEEMLDNFNEQEQVA